MSGWLAPSIVATLTATLVLAAVYSYLYLLQRERFMGLWAMSWAIYALRFAADLFGLESSQPVVTRATVQLAALVSAVLLLWGTFDFLGKRLPRWVMLIAALVGVWTLAAVAGAPALLGLSADRALTLESALNFAFVGAAFIWTGIAWLRASRAGSKGGWAVGTFFIVWGLHKWNYPFVRQIDSLAPVGFLVASALTLGVAIGIILVYYRRTLSALETSETRYRSLFDCGHAPMLVFDAVTGDIIDANSAAMDLYGYPVGRLRSMNILDLETMSDTELKLDLTRARERRSAAVSRHHHRTATGEIRAVEVHSGVQEIDGRDVLVGIVVDVTEVERTREALAESQERYAALFEGNRMMALIIEPETMRVIEANAAAVRYYGRSKDEFEGSLLMDLVRDDAEKTRELLMDSVVRDVAAYEAQHVRGDGATRTVEVQASPISIGGRTLLSLLLTDVTERNEAYADLRRYRDNLEKIVEARTSELEKANRELVAASRAKSQFLASMSHELRTPLNSIIGFTGILLQGLTGPLNDEQRRQLEMVNNSGRHLLELINAVLDLSKIEAGRVSLDVVEFDVNEVVLEAIESLRPMTQNKDLELVFSTDAKAAIARTDEMRLRQIILNLLGNAVKFTTEGVVQARVSIDEDTLSIAVSDSGPGIAREDLPHVFEEFRQLAPQSGEAKIPGTGLGLPVSVRLARLLGGSIEVESSVGTGSTFTLTVARMLDDSSAQGGKIAAIGDGAPGSSRTILLADDDPSIHDLFRIYLASEGVRVLHAYDLETAMRLLRRHTISAVVLDLEFEEASGWSLLKRVKEDQALGNVPVIICSVSDERERGRKLGAFAFLVKPVSKDDLVREVRRALRTPKE